VVPETRNQLFNILKASRTGTLSQDRYCAALGGLEGLVQFINI
jgi:hypothetical protein